MTPETSVRSRRPTGLGLGFACLALLGGPADRAAAHEAPAGWSYDMICCSSLDCRPVSAATVKATRTGWRIEATGEVIAYPLVRPSRDGSFHRCSVGGLETTKTICLYVPEMTQ